MSWREKHHSHDAKNKERIRLVYIRKVKELVRKIFLSTMIMNHQAKKKLQNIELYHRHHHHHHR
jgi:hypothetical protein